MKRGKVGREIRWKISSVEREGMGIIIMQHGERKAGKIERKIVGEKVTC